MPINIKLFKSVLGNSQGKFLEEIPRGNSQEKFYMTISGHVAEKTL